MKVHILKISPLYYEDVAKNIKKFEVRNNDRDFKLHDILILKEWNNGYTGRETIKQIKYILSDHKYVKENYVILGL